MTQEENMIEDIISLINDAPGCLESDKRKMTEFLRSRINRSEWKPTNEQVSELRALLDYNIGVYKYNRFIVVDSLCNELEDLIH